MIEKPQDAVLVPLYGRVEHNRDRQGNYNPMWLDWQVGVGVPHDMPILRYGGQAVNYLPLYTPPPSPQGDTSPLTQADYTPPLHQKPLSTTNPNIPHPTHP